MASPLFSLSVYIVPYNMSNNLIAIIIQEEKVWLI